MAKEIIRLCEVGILLKEDDREFESYNMVWNKKYGFYNENNILCKECDTETIIEYAKEYVKQGVDMTYAIVADEGVCEYDDPFDDGDLDIIGENKYDMEKVIYSIAKIQGNIIVDFLNKNV